MDTYKDLLKLLQLIIEADHTKKLELIKEFQNSVWHNENLVNEDINEILVTLAYDLDYFEPNEKWRREAGSYYDDRQLENSLLSIIKQLKNLED